MCAVLIKFDKGEGQALSCMHCVQCRACTLAGCTQLIEMIFAEPLIESFTGVGTRSKDDVFAA
jgi:hypothetical protein